MSIASVIAVVVVAQAAQFDLICAGRTETWIELNDTQVTDSNWRIRVDLDRKLACWDDCDVVSAIDRVDATRIVFSDVPGGSLVTVDRHTGSFFNSFQVNDSDGKLLTTQTTEGRCEPAEFTGIPAPKF